MYNFIDLDCFFRACSKIEGGVRAVLVRCMLAAMADEEARKAFAQLKPVCIDVMRSLSVENLGRLDGALRPPQRLTSPLVAYALFPLRMGIRKLGG